MTQRRKRYDRQFKVSAAKVVLSGEMTVKDLSEELGIKDSTLRRWACEYEEMGDDAFPGNGSPKINKDYEIVKLKKKVVGWSMSERITEKVAIDAIEQAVGREGPPDDGSPSSSMTIKARSTPPVPSSDVRTRMA